MMNKPDSTSFDALDQSDGADEVTKPIGAGAFGADTPMITGEIGKPTLKLRSSSIVLAIVVVAAMVGLFSMRTLAKVTAVVSGNQEMEQVIEDFLNSSSGRSVFMLNAPSGDAVAKSNQVLEVLNETYTERQVPLADVQKDPFVIFDATPAETKTASNPNDGKPSEIERKRAERKQQLNTIASRLMLKSVMLGDVPLANINGQIVRPGEILTIMPERQEFEVLSIDADVVRLSATDLTLGVRIEVDVAINRDKSSGRKR